MKKKSLSSCPVCGEMFADDIRECPNCGAVLPVHAALAKKVRRPWYLQKKLARRISAEKTLEREIKSIGRNLDAGDFPKALKKYHAIRESTKSYKPQKVWGSLFDLLEKSAGLLGQLKSSLDAAGKQQNSLPQPKAARPTSLAGRLATIPVLILAGMGLLGLFNLLPAKPDSNSPITQVVTIVATEVTPDVLPTVTPSAKPLFDPIPIGSNNIDKVQDLFRWSAGEDITSLSFSPNGNFVASGDGAGKIKVWKLWTDQPVFELSGTQVAFSPDGKWIGVAGPDGLELYNASDGVLVRSFDKDHPYFSVLFSPDSQLIVGGSDIRKIFIWSVNDGAEQKSGGSINGPIHSLSFSQDGLLLAAASNESTYVWNLQKQKIQRSVDFPKQKPVYYSITVDGDGEWFAMGHEDGQIYIWRISNGERMAVFNDTSRFVRGLQFFHGTNSPEILVSGDEVNFSFWIMDGRDTSLRRSIYTSTPILSLAIAPENKVIATGGNDGVIHLWGVVP